MQRSKRLLIAAFIALMIAGCDQTTKYQAVGNLTNAFDNASSVADRIDRFLSQEHPRGTDTVKVLPGYWDLRYVENPGAAFSFLSRAPSRLSTAFLLLLSLLALGFLGRFLWRCKDAWLSIAAALIFGGALGNLVDRVRLGYVIDFVYWHWLDVFHWPVFNMADAAISVGVVLLMARSFYLARKSALQTGI